MAITAAERNTADAVHNNLFEQRARSDSLATDDKVAAVDLAVKQTNRSGSKALQRQENLTSAPLPRLVPDTETVFIIEYWTCDAQMLRYVAVGFSIMCVYRGHPC